MGWRLSAAEQHKLFADFGRKRFFSGWLTKLRSAASVGYDALTDSCRELQSLLNSCSYSPISLLTDIFVLKTLPVDTHSKRVLPSTCRHLVPIKTEADGNCLYRYANMSTTS